MHNKFRFRFGFPCSDNLKSKTCGERRRTIENPKWSGLVAFALVLVVAGAVASAQQPSKIPTIGILSGGSTSNLARLEVFRQGLRELGYIEGQNIAIEVRYTEGSQN